MRSRHDGGDSIYVLAEADGVAPQTVSRVLAYEIHKPRGVCVVPLLAACAIATLQAIRCSRDEQES